MFKEWWEENYAVILFAIMIIITAIGFKAAFQKSHEYSAQQAQQVQDNCKLALNKMKTASDTIAIYTANHECLK